MPDGAIAGIADRCCREFLIRRLQLLQARDIRRGVPEPIKQIGEASVDAVDVVGRDPHASSSPRRELSPRRYLEYGTIGNPNLKQPRPYRVVSHRSSRSWSTPHRTVTSGSTKSNTTATA